MRLMEFHEQVENVETAVYGNPVVKIRVFSEDGTTYREYDIGEISRDNRLDIFCLSADTSSMGEFRVGKKRGR